MLIVKFMKLVQQITSTLTVYQLNPAKLKYHIAVVVLISIHIKIVVEVNDDITKKKLKVQTYEVKNIWKYNSNG